LIRFLNSYSNIIQIVVGILSLLATIFISFFIYYLQKCHEREIEEGEVKAHKAAITEAAKVFLIDNHSETGYLPLCVMAASANKYGQQHRAIYGNFNKCPVELQTEILRQANVPIKVPDNSGWIPTYIEGFRKDVEKYQLGRDILYDGAKYFRRSINSYAGVSVFSYRQVQFDVPVMSRQVAAFSKDLKSDLTKYIDRYLEFVLGDFEDTRRNPELLPQEPPFDMLFRTQRLESCPEQDVCFWLMMFIRSSCFSFFNHNLVTHGNEDWRYVDSSDAIMETFEDMYYSALLKLFETYSDSGNI